MCSRVADWLTHSFRHSVSRCCVPFGSCCSRRRICSRSRYISRSLSRSLSLCIVPTFELLLLPLLLLYCQLQPPLLLLMPVNCRRVRAAIAIAAAGNLNRGKKGAAPHSIVLGNGALCVFGLVYVNITLHICWRMREKKKRSPNRFGCYPVLSFSQRGNYSPKWEGERKLLAAFCSRSSFFLSIFLSLLLLLLLGPSPERL